MRRKLEPSEGSPTQGRHSPGGVKWSDRDSVHEIEKSAQVDGEREAHAEPSLPPRRGRLAVEAEPQLQAEAAANDVQADGQQSPLLGSDGGARGAWNVIRLQRLLWAAPALLLMCSLVVQNMGLYAGTRSYVRWMDDLDGHLSDGTGWSALVDPPSTLLGGGAEQADGTSSLDVLVGLVLPVWCCTVIWQRDARLWTRTLIAGAVLAALKGFLAVVTIIPDSDGWDACKARLGSDGLRFFRHGSSWGYGFGFVEELLDILLLSLRNLLIPGESKRARLCADAVSSGPGYLLALFSLSLYDAAKLFSAALDDRQRFAVRSFTGVLLTLAVVMDLLLSVTGRYHYSVDAIMALTLTLLLYSDPAVALSAERWLAICSSPSDSSSTAASASMLAAAVGEDSGPPCDVGRISGPLCLPPTGGPRASGGYFFLRDQPGPPCRAGRRRGRLQRLDEQRSEQDRHWQQGNSLRKAACEAAAEQARGLQEHSRPPGAPKAAEELREARERMQVDLKAERCRLDSEARVRLSEAQQELEGQRHATSQLEERVAHESLRCCIADDAFCREAASLAAEAQAGRLAAAKAREERKNGEENIRDLEAESRRLRVLLAGSVARSCVAATVRMAERQAKAKTEAKDALQQALAAAERNLRASGHLTGPEDDASMCDSR